MALRTPKFVREPPMLTHAIKNFSYWKRVMTNYMKLIEVWEAVENGFTPVYNSTSNIITTESKLAKNVDDLAMNAIMETIHESLWIVFSNAKNAKEMLDFLITKYEGNDQIKRTKLAGLAISKKKKLAGLETKFETFFVESGETVEDTYNRLLQIQHEFIELGQPLSNNKIVGKLLRVMLRKPGWESMISALEVLSGVQVFTPEELFAHLRSCEEKLRQTEDYKG